MCSLVLQLHTRICSGADSSPSWLIPRRGVQFALRSGRALRMVCLTSSRVYLLMPVSSVLLLCPFGRSVSWVCACVHLQQPCLSNQDGPRRERWSGVQALAGPPSLAPSLCRPVRSRLPNLGTSITCQTKHSPSVTERASRPHRPQTSQEPPPLVSPRKKEAVICNAAALLFTLSVI